LGYARPARQLHAVGAVVIELDIELLHYRFELMAQQLDEFPNTMATELTAWQLIDMHRKRPETTLRDNVAETSIQPPDRQKIRRRSLRRRFRKSSRPILCDVLRKKLIDRMGTLLESLSWQ
jgi:hypothetical protein